MAVAPRNTHNKRSLIRTSHICHRCRAAGRNQQVEEYKHTHIHTAAVKFKERCWNCNDVVVKGIKEVRVVSEAAYIILFTNKCEDV